jgi:hypothetical protein
MLRFSVFLPELHCSVLEVRDLIDAPADLPRRVTVRTFATQNGRFRR